MSKPRRRFVARAHAGQGWRIWDSTIGRWWGEAYSDMPEQLLQELNGGKRPEQLQQLQQLQQQQKQMPRKR